MAQLGTVQSIKGKHVYVKVLREGACAHCNACTSGFNEGKECLIEAVNGCNAKVGDTVEIDVKVDYFLRATAIMYGIPLLALIIGIIIPSFIMKTLDLPQSDTISTVVGLAFTAITYLVIRQREKKKEMAKYLPVAISKS